MKNMKVMFEIFRAAAGYPTPVRELPSSQSGHYHQ